MSEHSHIRSASLAILSTTMTLLLAACTTADLQTSEGVESTVTLQPQVNLPNCAEQTDSDSLNVYCLFNSAVLLRDAGYLERAKQEFHRVLSVDERHVLSHQYLGDIYFEEGDLTLAEEMYRTVVMLDPSNSITHRNLGVVYDRIGETDKAISNYLASIELNPLSAQTHYNLGLAYSRDRASMAQALTEMLRAIELDSSVAKYHYDLAQIYQYLSRRAEAETHYQRAAELGYSP